MILINSPPESLATESLREGVEASEGLRLLGRLAAIASIDRNLESEDAAADRDARLNDAEVYGADAVNAAKPPEGEEMRIMAARDVHVHQPPEPQPSPPEPTPAPAQQAPPPLPSSQPKSRRASMLKKAALAAVVLSSGGALCPLVLAKTNSLPTS